MIRYKGYTATVEFDPDEMLLHGRVNNLRDIIIFHASAVGDVQREFEVAIEDYIAFCHERGVEPEQPYSGTLTIRLDSELHLAIAAAAEADGRSIDEWIATSARSSLNSASSLQDPRRLEDRAEIMAQFALLTRNMQAYPQRSFEQRFAARHELRSAAGQRRSRLTPMNRSVQNRSEGNAD